MISRQVARGAITKDWLEYVTDAYQRGVLFLDLLRRRGNEEEEITAQPMATVLHFDHEVLMSGRSFRRPINFALSRIVPPRGVEIDPRKRPVVVVDPRAESEVLPGFVLPACNQRKQREQGRDDGWTIRAG
jgi:hypothetical protein